jgi:hypothetical protein
MRILTSCRGQAAEARELASAERPAPRARAVWQPAALRPADPTMAPAVPARLLRAAEREWAVAGAGTEPPAPQQAAPSLWWILRRRIPRGSG